MRVVHITDVYPPRSHPIADQVGGLARRQGLRGDAVHVLTAVPLEEAEPGRSRFRTSTTDGPGVRVHRFASRLSLGASVLPRGRALIERALRLLRPDAVHLHLPGPSLFGYDAARAVRGLDLPLVITAYSGAAETFSRFAVRVAGWASAPAITSGVTPRIAERTAEVFAEEGAHVLPLGVDLAPWAAAGARWERVDDLRILLHAAEPSKRLVDGVMRAQQRVGGRVCVTAAGRFSGGMKSPDVDLGDAPAEVLPALSAEHDLYISGAGLDPHAAGAAAAGLVLIGHRDSSLEGVIGGGGIEGEPGARAGGFLVDGAPDVEESIVSLLDSPLLRARMRASNLEAAGREEITRHDWPHVLHAADLLYQLARVRIREYGPSAPR